MPPDLHQSAVAYNDQWQKGPAPKGETLESLGRGLALWLGLGSVLGSAIRSLAPCLYAVVESGNYGRNRNWKYRQFRRNRNRYRISVTVSRTVSKSVNTDVFYSEHSRPTASASSQLRCGLQSHQHCSRCCCCCCCRRCTWPLNGLSARDAISLSGLQRRPLLTASIVVESLRVTNTRSAAALPAHVHVQQTPFTDIPQESACTSLWMVRPTSEFGDAVPNCHRSRIFHYLAEIYSSASICASCSGGCVTLLFVQYVIK